MSAAFLLLLALVTSLEGIGRPGTATAPGGDGDVVLFLIAGAPAASVPLDSAALVEAVTIYTRDLRLRVESVSMGATGGPTPARAAEIAALVRTRSARLAFWCVPAGDGRRIGVFLVDPRGALRTDEVAGDEGDGPDRFRAVALKLRAALVGAADADSREVTTSTATAGASTPVASSQPPAPASSSVSAPVGAGGFGLSIEARASRAAGQDFFREAVAIEGFLHPRAVAWGEMALAIEAALPVGKTVAAGSVTVLDFPLRLGARFHHQAEAGRLAVAVGPFGAVHALGAYATAAQGGDGRRDRRWTAAAGFGAEAVVRGPIAGRWSWLLGGWIEGIVPRTRFLVSGTTALQTASFAGGLVLGVTVSPR